MAGGPSRPRHSRCLLLPAKGPPQSCIRRTPNPRSLNHPSASLSLYPPPRCSTGLSSLLPARALQSSAAYVPTRSAVTSPSGSGSRGRVMCSPRPAPKARAAGPRARGRRGREHRGATPDHTVLAGEDFLLGGRVGAVNPASPAAELGLGDRASLRGSGSVDKEEERIPGPHSVGGPCGPGTCGRNSRAAHCGGGG